MKARKIFNTILYDVPITELKTTYSGHQGCDSKIYYNNDIYIEPVCRFEGGLSNIISLELHAYGIFYQYRTSKKDIKRWKEIFYKIENCKKLKCFTNLHKRKK